MLSSIDYDAIDSVEIDFAEMEYISYAEGIANVVVTGVPDNFWSESIACAIVMKDGYVFNESALRASLASKLAKFKIPEHFFIYDSFPSLPNGKVDMVSLKKDLEQKTKRE